jgi:signal transduction histidine kinase
MRERAERLGGVLELESVPGSGTTIHARIPAQRMEVLTSDG